MVGDFAFVQEEATIATKQAINLVQQWDPVDSISSCTGIARALMHIVSVAESPSPQNTQLQEYATNDILQCASCRLSDLFYCLINAKFASHHVVETIVASAQHPSRWFFPSSLTSSVSGERDSSSYWSSVSSSRKFGQSNDSIKVSVPKINQNNPMDQIERASESESISDLFSKVISNLKELVNMMNLGKCGHIFDAAFREAIQQAVETNYLTALGFYQRDKDFVLENLGSIELSVLRQRRRKWEWAFKVVVCEVLPWIKCLCYEIFANTDKLQARFYGYVNICLQPLLEFADAATSAMSGRIERVFHQLYVHEVLRELSSNVSALFSTTAEQVHDTVHLPRQNLFLGDLTQVLNRLADAIVRSLADFKRQIQGEKSCSIITDVGVHQLTCSTMRTVKKLANYQRSLDFILHGENLLLSGNDRNDNNDVTIYESEFCELVLNIISSLKSKLKQKFELLKTSGAQQVFCINNLNYILEEGASPQLKIVLGEKWAQEQEEEIQVQLTSFKKKISTEILSCLTRPNKITAEKRLKSFKLAIEEMCQIQASWKVPDPERREELRNAVLETVGPHYTEFLDVHNSKLKKNVTEKMLSVADMESCLLDLFEGSG